MAKEVYYKGKTLDQIMKMGFSDFINIVPSRARRTLKRGFTSSQKSLLLKIKRGKEGKLKKPVRTHCRDIVIIPEMVGVSVHVHNGKEFIPVQITHEMLGRPLGEFLLTRKKVAHSSPGIGATKSSAAMSVK